MGKWTEDDKLKALAIAETSSIKEASEKTGIPEGTIKRWRKEVRESEPNRTERTEPPKKIREITEQAIEEVKGEVREYVADRVKQVADKMMRVNELALEAIEQVIREGPKEDESNAQWLRSLVGAMSQGIEKHQLLEGKPTQRQEVKQDVSVTDDRYQKALRDIRESIEELRRPTGAESSYRGIGTDQGLHPPVKH